VLELREQHRLRVSPPGRRRWVASERRHGVALAAALVALLALTPAADAATRLRLDGVGPLHLGMKRAPALATGWLSNRSSGCELGGPPLPIDYRLRGRKAPSGIRGSAEFTGGRLRTLVFTRGVRTALGVTVGKTTVARMVARYRAAGFGARAQYVSTFQGTFVTVRKHGRAVLGGFAEGSTVTTLGIPTVPVCE